MARVNRMELLQSLQMVQPGISVRDIVEQSSCFVFKDGEVFTYNDEIACRMVSPLEDFTGAVQALPLINVLSKLPEDEVTVLYENGELLVRGKKRRAGIRMETEITLPIDSAEKPGEEWTPLHDDFLEAIRMVQDCAGKDESKFALTCVHVHPKWVEACDNFQLTRYRMKTGISEPCLIRKDSLKHIVVLDMQEFNETKNWIHFRAPGGMVLSCRRYIEEYPNLKPIFDFTGMPTQLPKGLKEAVEKAEIFSSENADNNQVRIDIKTGKLQIKGIGNSGWYAEQKKITYDGPPIVFQIGPKLLTKLVERHNDCEITANRLKVDGGKWTYVTCLGLVEEQESDKEKGGGEESDE